MMKCFVLVLVMMIVKVIRGQLAWTPIFVDGSSQIDLWTQSSSGCTCPGGSSENCACCVREGACPCGEEAPTRCAQCGLEQHCGNMCNITIDSRILKLKSGRTFGQIKSPSIQGPGMCSYLLQPDTGQRVEIQVYRLVAAGRFNGTSCVGGYLQLADGAGATRAADTRLCGINERYTPPVVLFADHGASTLEFHITERTSRSQFLAYFSFTSLSNAQGVGFHPKGGSRIPQTDCDWLYQDLSCRTPGSCVLASPGYPGLYPPMRRCRYLLTTSSVHTRIKIVFTSILLPNNHCTSDYLSLRAGSTPTAPLLASLCSERKATLEHPGPNLLLEFKSPNCRSSIEILDGIWDGTPINDPAKAHLKICGPSSREAREPSGNFAPRRALVSRTANVTLIVRRSAANINHPEEDFLDGAFLFHDEKISGTASSTEACGSSYYGMAAPEHGDISAPIHHHLFWNHEGRLICTHRFIPGTNQSVTLQVDSLHGMRSMDPINAVLDESEDDLRHPMGPSCSTLCGDFGCMCQPDGELNTFDHMAIIAEDGNMLSCLCGDFKSEFLPVSVRSWTPIRLEYSVAHYTYTSRGFDFGASYSFYDDVDCGQRIFTTHTGEISSKNISSSQHINAFFYQQCTWILDSNVDRQLYLEISTDQDRQCTSWNITLHEWVTKSDSNDVTASKPSPHVISTGLARHAGPELHSFCPRQKLAMYELPWRVNTIVIRVAAMSRQHPEYLIKWKSQVVRANTRLGPPTPAPAAASAHNLRSTNIFTLVSVTICLSRLGSLNICVGMLGYILKDSAAFFATKMRFWCKKMFVAFVSNSRSVFELLRLIRVRELLKF